MLLPPVNDEVVVEDGRKYLREKVQKAFSQIVDGFLEKAAEGSVQHLKLALEVMESAEEDAMGGEQKSKLQLLMEEMGLE